MRPNKIQIKRRKNVYITSGYISPISASCNFTCSNIS